MAQAALYNDRDGGDDPDAPVSAVERIEKFKEASKQTGSMTPVYSSTWYDSVVQFQSS